MTQPVYRRILLKLSGEALAAGQGFGVDNARVHEIAGEIQDVHQLGVEVGIVVGGGNFFRGVAEQAREMDRVSADHMGMLATMINALALQDALEKRQVFTRVMSAIEMNQVAEPFIRRRAIRHLEKGRVVDLRGRNRQSVFLHRYRGVAARHGDQGRRDHQSHQGGRHLRPPIRAGERRHAMYEHISYMDVLKQGLRSDGRHRHQSVPGKQSADCRLQLERQGEHPAGGAGREGWIARQPPE